MLLVFVTLCLAAGRLGAAITEPALEGWYRGLAKPDWTPPDLVFPVAWTLLFVTMGIAAWLVWNSVQSGWASGSSRNRAETSGTGMTGASGSDTGSPNSSTPAAW